jgi:hypothetical protein
LGGQIDKSEKIAAPTSSKLSGAKKYAQFLKDTFYI